MNPSFGLDDEDELVWVEPIGSLDYVRESTVLEARRTSRQPRCPTGRLIGYTTLRKDAVGSGGCYERRIFWLKSHDRGYGPDRVPGYYNRPSLPAEGVDPRTVRAGVPGAVTDRCRFGPSFDRVDDLIPVRGVEDE